MDGGDDKGFGGKGSGRVEAAKGGREGQLLVLEMLKGKAFYQ